MASNRGRLTRGSSSRAHPTPNIPTFPNFKFLSEAHAKKYLKLVDYNIVREKAFAIEDLQGFIEVLKVLQQRCWVSFNNLIREANKNIGLEFYANTTFGKESTYTSYVRGKYIDYSPSVINSLFNLQHPPVCALSNYRHEHKAQMTSQRERLTRGSSSRVAPTPNAPTFPNLKFLFEAHAEKYLKLVDYHIVRERAFLMEDLQGLGEVVKVLQQRC
ncbi:hypothetical protein KIW84_052858 [Lathyrus oleraceus]|uniref:Uncharacterized protein n=1 Tax=Pisum sativum TaxID=3888 RepID=A0A9D4WNR2_PEA|nr:hypothetical protein KIW84_052858 [Pisum sativum]